MIIETFSITRKNYRQVGPLLLRLIIGFGFMAHGGAKLSRGTAGFEKLLAQTGVPFAHISSWIVPLTELLGGLAMFLGLFVSITAIPLIIVMLSAMLTVQINYGFSAIKTIGLTPHGPLFGPPGYEINLLYIAGLISLILTGGGVFSLDALIVKKKAGK
ncbi:DoxX family protein [Mucilaginibacter sp. OK098]|uniref:DoxX family protein n=1 Tax=Mucilaginibacter sp. OK098 TaxID=1855297 RepID=UPI000933E33A|nr:DoxX family protein [Mucilaginibacter sp. OK098]